MTTFELYTGQADLIEDVLARICAARRLVIDVCEEFSSWARLRLIENDSAILRKFAGRSSARTYLITVVQRLYLDWRDKEWGKWRPSAQARRSGPLAIELERLILRDHLTFDQAMESLRSAGIEHSRDECAALWAQLPQRPSRRPTTESELADAAAPAVVDEVAIDEQRARATRAGAALATCVAALEPADRLIVKLRYEDGFSVARIAQLMEHDQKALYRKIDRLLAQLREALRAAGVLAADVSDLLGSSVVEFPSAFQSDAGKSGIGPSNDATEAKGGP